MSEQTAPSRCSWSLASQQYIDYHDDEWGVPVHDDRKLFEMLILEGAQAGLSWATILKKRAAYLQLFDNFDAEKIVRYDEQKVQELLTNPAIIRNRLKIQATLQNARALLQLQSEIGSFDAFLWQFVDGKPMQNAWRTMQEVPATSKEADALSKELKRRGFTFVGSTVCYAFMQAVGMVNDHIVECFRWQEVKALTSLEKGSIIVDAR